jgi:hypothetical protein
VHCYLQLKLFGKQQSVDLLLDAQHTNDVTRSDEQVGKNRLISRVCIGAKGNRADQKVPLRDHDGSSILLNKGKFVKFLIV